MKWLRTLLSAALAGLMIGIGGIVFLSLDSKVLGAVLFTVGLFTICVFGLSLFTGKVCYLPGRDLWYRLSIPVIWLGNLAGTWVAARLILATRYGEPLAARARELCEIKLADSGWSIFLLAVFCNILIYMAVENFNRHPHEICKYLALFLGVIIFILCGFEHCVANMFYFSLAGAWSGQAAIQMLIMTLGNSVGGMLLPVCRSFLKERF